MALSDNIHASCSLADLSYCCAPCADQPVWSGIAIAAVVAAIFAVSIAIAVNAFPGMGLSLGARVGICVGMNVGSILIISACIGGGFLHFARQMSLPNRIS